MRARRKFGFVYAQRFCLGDPRSVSLRSSGFSTRAAAGCNGEVHESSRFLAFCNSQIAQHGRHGNVAAAESVFNGMPRRNTVSWTAMLTAYAQNGKISKAEKVFDEMPDRTTASYNAMITAYVKNKCDVDLAYELFKDIPEKNSVSYAAMITGFAHAGMLEKAEELHSQVSRELRDPVSSNALIKGYLKFGRFNDAVRVFEGMGEKDVVSWSSVIHGYCKMGQINNARGLFDRMLEKNVVTWTTMIAGYFKAGSFLDGYALFISMRREGVARVNSTTLTVMSEACGNLGRYREGTQIHGLALKMGFGFDVFLGNSIITMYCRSGFANAARAVFDSMGKKDIVSWNSMVSGYFECGQNEQACELFQKMPMKDVVSWTTTMTAFTNRGNMAKCLELFRKMPEKDDIAWTAVISGYVNNGEHSKAIFLFMEMLKEAVRPNYSTFSSALSAAAGMASLSLGLQIHSLVWKMGMEYEISIQNSLITTYSKCGNMEEAYKIFTGIDEPDVVSCNSMISGFSQNGCGERALNLFTEMQREEKVPNDVTFLSVLSACAHAGLVEPGWNYFRLMSTSYNIEQGPDHYACMVDLLGRTGKLDEATDLINSMPCEPHSGVWGALLGASEKYLRSDLAELAAKKIMKLEPDNATPYIVLSRLYSALGKKRDGDRVRNTKKSKGIRKNPGCSWML